MGELCEEGIELLKKVNDAFYASRKNEEDFAIDYNSDNSTLQFVEDDENGRYISFHAKFKNKYYLVFIWVDYHTEWSAVEIESPVK